MGGMSEFDVSGFMKDVVGGLMTVTDSVKIIGEPVTIGDKVVIPAVVAKVGFGAGGGSGKSADEGPQEGSGGGGGGGVTMTPVFLIVDGDGERLMTVPGPFDAASSMFEKAKGALDRVMPRKSDGEDLAEDEELRDLEEGASGAAH